MRQPLLQTVLVAAFAISLTRSGRSQTPQLQKVAKLPSLVPLTISVGGRALSAASTAIAGFAPEEYVAQWPGTYFEASFKGTELYLSVGASHEILHLVVDGQPPIILSDPATGVYRLSGLEDKPHAVEVQVVTESQAAPNRFGGFAITADEKPLPPPRRDRQMEFIGDSHTVGYGNISPKQECTTDEVWATTDNSQAFGPLTAAHYQADYQVNAISGHGVVRNYDGFAGDPVPQAYPYVLFDKKQAYGDPAWKPQVIVISLGTNDFSTPLHAGEVWKTRDELHADYEKTYVRFLQGLRAKNPDAYIILWATQLANDEIDSEVRKVMEQATAQGVKNITFIPVDRLSFTGCHGHPSVADDKTIRDRLVQAIDATPAIWKRR